MSNQDAFVLMKRGVFWRPHSCGYTSNLLFAGIYYRSEIREEWWSGDGFNETVAIPLLTAIDGYLADRPTPEILALLNARTPPTTTKKDGQE
jgi:hypothetical protein